MAREAGVLAFTAGLAFMLANNGRTVKDRDGPRGNTYLQHLARQLVRHRIMLIIGADVIVPADFQLLVFHELKRVSRQWLQLCGFFRGKEFLPRRPVHPSDILIDLYHPLGDRRIEFVERSPRLFG